MKGGKDSKRDGRPCSEGKEGKEEPREGGGGGERREERGGRVGWAWKWTTRAKGEGEKGESGKKVEGRKVWKLLRARASKRWEREERAV